MNDLRKLRDSKQFNTIRSISGKMEEIQAYFNIMGQLQEKLLMILEDDAVTEKDLNDCIHFFKDQKIRPKDFLHLISRISDHHQRNSTFFSRIESILKKISQDIKQNFSNEDIFSIFKNNKRILLFLFNEHFIIPNKKIFTIITTKKYQEMFYPEYF